MTCCSCYSCFVKTNAFLVALLAIAVLAISSTVLASSVSYNRHGSYKNDSVLGNQDNSGSIEADSENIPSNSSISKSISNEAEQAASPFPLSSLSSTLNLTYNIEEGTDANRNQMSTTESFNSTVQQQNALFDKLSKFWKSKSDTYIQLMQASSGTAMFAALLQLAFSWFLICGSTKKDMKERTKLWNLSNLIVLILLVVIILVPLSFSISTNKFKAASVFGREIMRRIKSVEFSAKTLEIMWSSVSNFLEKDVTLFYYVLGADAVVLLTFLLPPLLCCLLYPFTRCCCKSKSKRTDSDLMLFGPNEPF